MRADISDVAPFAERQVGCDGDGGAFFSFGDDLEEQFGASCVELANPLREECGLEPIRPLPGAYEPASEVDEPY